MPSHRPVTACTRRSPRTARAAGAVLAAGASLALVAGCASATNGTGTQGAGAAAMPAAATSSAAAPTITGLATRVATAVAGAKSVHLSSDVPSVPGLPVQVGSLAGDVALAQGRPTAASVTAGVFSLRYVDGTAWVTLPGTPAATPWTLVATTSSNPIVAMAATKLAELKTKLATLDPTKLLGAASGLREVGPAQVGGTAATEYTFSIDPAALATALGVDATQVGTGPVPVQVWLDGSDLPLQVTATPTVRGTKTPLTVTLSKWNAPVSITAPAASQVAR